MRTFCRLAVLAAVALLPVAAQDNFQLKNGDRVVFFGDSITDQRLYTTFVETFAVTRFPDRQITFTHSGWGGDRVTGGGGGGVAQRLSRDVIAYKPNVVTIMLGMNDGRYRAFDDQIFSIFSNGYQKIVTDLKAALPGVRITAIKPSPYDDVTQAPGFPGGYNAVLLRYSDFLAEMAAKESIGTADLNTRVTAMLAKAKETDAQLALKIIPDRVHPGPAGHLIMAASLLKDWGAPEVVSTVELDAKGKKVASSANTSVEGATFGPVIAWTETDKSLPMAIDLRDPVVALAVNSSDFMDTLNRQTVKVAGLADGQYTLKIDGSETGTFSASDLAAGVNLARFRTPMWEQAARVHVLTLKHTGVHNVRWRTFEVPLAGDNLTTLQATMSALEATDAELIRQQRAAAQPRPHKFELVAGASSFRALFNGKDLSGWHISQTNHHGKTQDWKVGDGGVLSGSQDRPGHGGILLTDRKYQNFEVRMDINPDYGCDGGLFLRSNERGQAYQVLLDYLDGGAIGGVYGEKLEGVATFVPDWQTIYRRNEWNELRARIEGDVPHIQVWLNGYKVTDWKDTANHLPEGAHDGMVAVQVHAGNRWIPGGKQRFRNVSIRELPGS